LNFDRGRRIGRKSLAVTASLQNQHLSYARVAWICGGLHRTQIVLIELAADVHADRQREGVGVPRHNQLNWHCAASDLPKSSVLVETTRRTIAAAASPAGSRSAARNSVHLSVATLRWCVPAQCAVRVEASARFCAKRRAQNIAQRRHLANQPSSFLLTIVDAAF
jgi:hypothetical protein